MLGLPLCPLTTHADQVRARVGVHAAPIAKRHMSLVSRASSARQLGSGPSVYCTAQLMRHARARPDGEFRETVAGGEGDVGTDDREHTSLRATHS